MKSLRLFLIILFTVFFGSTVGVGALSGDQRNVFDAGVNYYDTDAEESCLGGAFGSGPLYGPRFPQISDTKDLANRIKDYISNTVPDSPLVQQSEYMVSSGQQYDVNPVLLVAMAQKETSLGTAGNGTPSGGYNITNIRSSGGWARYSGYPGGIDATYKNLNTGLYLGPPSNFTTIAQIINRWAPPTDNNDTVGYIKFVGDVMQKILQGIGTSDNSVDSETDVSSGCGSSGGSGLVNTEGYAFPVAPQTKKGNGGVEGLSQLPCPQVSCHHDGTAAFDIGRQPGGDESTGAPVYAISDGQIDLLHIYDGIDGCYSLQLHSSQDNTWYWYGHLQNPLVENRQKVKAGQQVAEIGLRKCTGNGSTPHLHIDRGCIINGQPQKGGRESCRDPDFTPFMNKLFNSLPEA